MSLDSNGYVIIHDVIAEPACQQIGETVLSKLRGDRKSAIEASHQPSLRELVGGRNLLSLWDGWSRVTNHPHVAELVRQYVGKDAGLVRGLYFDKPPGQGWSLALHRDLTIAVAEHPPSPAPFSKPTRKADVPHVEATTPLLGRMLTLRLHLDEMGDSNGPLVVIPGSHRDLDANQSAPPKTIHCGAGDVFAMRPLLLHGSRASDPSTHLHRRVLHLEIAPTRELPGAYRWHHFEPLFENAGFTEMSGIDGRQIDGSISDAS